MDVREILERAITKSVKVDATGFAPAVIGYCIPKQYEAADAALSALEEAGYVVVPKEPDEVMREAAVRYCDEKVGEQALLGTMRNAFVEIALDGYRAMVAARL